MARFLSLTWVLLLGFVLPAVAQPLDYPDTKTVDTVDVYHGTEVEDPYRWLEDLDAADTEAWIEKQNDLTFSYLQEIRSRSDIHARMTELYDHPKYGVPTRRGDRLFFERNNGLQNQPVTVTKMAGATGEPTVLFNPNDWSEDGTVALSSMVPSPDGNYVSYGVSESGSDWRTLQIRNVDTGEDLSDELKWIKFSEPTWLPDGSGFYYGRYPEPAEGEAYEAQTKGMKLYFHEVGTPQSADRLVFEQPEEPKIGFATDISDDGQFLVITAWKGTADENLLYVKDLNDPDPAVRAVVGEMKASYEFVGNDGETFFLLTNEEAPNKRLVSLDISEPDETMTTVIPESDAVLQDVERAGDRFVVHALDDVKARLTVHGLDGVQERQVELPAIGSITRMTASATSDHVYYGFASYTYPTTVYHANLSAQNERVFRKPEISAFDAGRYAVKQAFYTSKDGTRIPMFIVHNKGLKLDGSNPTLMYAYGGFNISLTPRFSVGRLVWLEMGGVYAVPNLRGGGEYGQAWHEAGMLENKQNVFDDFAAAGQYLIDEGYTSSEKLAIAGGSNGGLLTGASLVQNPDLFGAAIVSVGVLDMLRYHKFTIGWAWVPEYGSSDDPGQFDYLRAYSPLHNIEDGTAYPATLITTADTDDRVVPAHSYKFAARLQAAQGGDEPILLRVETKAGHGSGKPTSKIIEEQSDVYAFLARVLKVNTGEIERDTSSPPRR